MVPNVVLIDTGHPQAVPIVLDVVHIDRGHLQVVPMVPDVVPIKRGHPTLFPHAHRCCPHIIPMVQGTKGTMCRQYIYGLQCHPQYLGTT